MKLCGAVDASRVILRPKVEGLILSVGHFSHFRGEDVFKNEVGGIQDLLPGAEVFGKQYLPLLPFYRLLIGFKAVIFSQENGGVCQAEAVDTLLHIAYSKNILSVSGNRPEDGVLYLVGILILVHQDLLIPGGDLLTKLGRLAVRPHQQLQSKVLLVGKVRSVHAQLLLAVILLESPCQGQQSRHGGGHGIDVLHSLFRTDLQKGRELFHVILAALPHPFEGCHRRIVLAALGRGEAGEFNRLHPEAGILPVFSPRKVSKSLGCHAEFFPVALTESLIPTHPFGGSGEHSGPVPGLAADQI